MADYTNTVTSATPLDANEMLRRIREAVEAPMPFGTLLGCPVFVSGPRGDRTVEIRTGADVISFSENHPYIQGTKLGDALKGK